MGFLNQGAKENSEVDAPNEYHLPLIPLCTGLPHTFPCGVRVQYLYTPTQTVDSVDNKLKFTRIDRRDTTINTVWMTNAVSVDLVVAGQILSGTPVDK